MKKILLICFLSFSFSLSNYAQISTDSLGKIVETGNKQIVTAINNQSKIINDSLKVNLKPAKAIIADPSPGISGIIVFLPVALFIYILMLVVFKLKKDKVRFSDFLIDKETKVAMKKEEVNVVVANANANIAAANAIRANAPAYTAANVPPPPIPAPNVVTAPIPFAADDNNPATPSTSGPKPEEQSTSRLIAFISGVTSVALAVCIASFYFYRSFMGDTNISIGNLANVLYGLGLGVVPYGFNKIASALK